jgi:hypothetical protein
MAVMLTVDKMVQSKVVVIGGRGGSNRSGG